MNPGTTLASDNFQRANENPLSYGGRWAAYLPGTFGNLEVASDVCQPSALSLDCSAYWAETTFPADQWASITLGALITNTTHIIFLRASAATETFYEGFVENGSGYQIRKFVAGTSTTLATAGVAPNSGDVVLFEAQGTNLTLSVNGITVATATDSSIASGLVAIDLYASSSTALSDSTITLFQAGNFLTPTRTWSAVDSRIFPNRIVTIQGTDQYTVQTSSNESIPSPDSREVGAPTDSRIASPQNSRSAPPF